MLYSTSLLGGDPSKDRCSSSRQNKKLATRLNWASRRNGSDSSLTVLTSVDSPSRDLEGSEMGHDCYMWVGLPSSAMSSSSSAASPWHIVQTEPCVLR